MPEKASRKVLQREACTNTIVKWVNATEKEGEKEEVEEEVPAKRSCWEELSRSRLQLFTSLHQSEGEN